MEAIDLILNIAALLLWFHWRALHQHSQGKIVSISILSNLQRPAARRIKHWGVLSALLLLLLVRALFFWHIGSKTNWSPRLNLGAISLYFPTTTFSVSLGYSLGHFIYLACIAYGWLLLISWLAGGRHPIQGPLTSMVRAQLGRLDHLPGYLKVILTGLVSAAVWTASFPVWRGLGNIPPIHSVAEFLEKAVLIGAGIYLTWKILIAAFLILYFLNQYAYLGNQMVWVEINELGKRLLYPLRNLQFGKLDPTPLLGIALVMLLSEGLDRLLTKLFVMAG